MLSNIQQYSSCSNEGFILQGERGCGPPGGRSTAELSSRSLVQTVALKQRALPLIL